MFDLEREALLSEPNDSSSSVKYNFDVLLDDIGNFGKYQALIVVFVFYLTFPSGMRDIGAVFLLAVPDHRCAIKGVDFDVKASVFNYNTTDDLICKSIPRKGQILERCKQFKSTRNLCWNSSSKLSNYSTIPCDSYVYDKSLFKKTVATEWNLVCDKLIWGTVANAVFFLGNLFGSLVGGSLYDCIGGKYMILVSNIGIIIAGVCCSFSPSFWVFVVIRFCYALFSSANFETSFIYVIEIVGGARARINLGLSFHCCYGIGGALLSGMAYVWRDWRTLQVAITLTSFPFLLWWVLIPESPRWLFAKGRNSEGRLTSEFFASKNGNCLSESTWSKASSLQSDSAENYYPIWVLFKGHRMRQISVINIIIWFVASLTYYGLSLGVGELSGNLLWNNVIMGLVQIPGMIFGSVIAEKIGRKLFTSAAFVVAGISCLGFVITTKYVPQIPEVGTSLAFFGMMAISTAYAILYCFTAELYPTVVRGTAVGLMSASAVIATIINPFIIYLNHICPLLPEAIFGVLSIAAGAASMKLPDTEKSPLMTTLEEAENFYNNS